MKKLCVNDFKAFFFDFDGVIVDSVDIKKEAFAELYKGCAKETIDRIVSHHIAHGGMSRFNKIRHYHKTYLDRDVSENELADLAEEFSCLVFEKVLKAPFINGAIEFLDILKREEKMILLVSGTPEDEIRRIVTARDLDGYFADVKGSPKSKGENVSILLKNHSIDGRYCAYFGDSKEDELAALNTHMTFVPINYFEGKKGYKDFKELL